ncbi:CRISPR-associated endonuclease Cas2 [Roseateles sp. GG27B]
MALNEVKEWIVAYDISNPRRLAKVHKLMVKNAIPLQKSVFMATMTVAQARKLRYDLAALIDPKADDIRMYPLPPNPDITRLGRNDIKSSGVFLD